MNRKSRIRRWWLQTRKRFKRNVNWKLLIFITIALNIATVVDGDWFNLKMNIAILLLTICAAYYD